MTVSADTPITQHINDLCADLSAARVRMLELERRAVSAECAHESANKLLIEAETERDQLRAEALAWHKQAEEKANTITVVLSMQMLRRLWAMARPGNNPCCNEED